MSLLPCLAKGSGEYTQSDHYKFSITGLKDKVQDSLFYRSEMSRFLMRALLSLKTYWTFRLCFPNI